MSWRIAVRACRVLLSLLVLWAAGPAMPAAAREAVREVRTYTELTTPHFTLLTTQEPARARELAQRLWTFRLALESLLGASLESSVPVSIFALEGDDWTRYAEPRSGLAGGFSSQPFAADLMFDASAGGRLVLELTLHEYTHHLLRSLGPGPSRLPPFLDEGLAELFGSARIGERSIRLAPRADLLAQLRTASWLPFERVLEVGRRDAMYVEHAQARVFYAQAWATAFYVLATDDPGQSRLRNYLAALRELEPDLDVDTRAVLQRRAAEALVGQPAGRANDAIGRFLLGDPAPADVTIRMPGAAAAAVPATVRRIGQDEYDVRLAELMLRLGNRATLARSLFRAVPADSPFAARARAGAALAVLQSGERPFAAALLDDPALENGVDPATAVRLGRGLLQLGLPSSREAVVPEAPAVTPPAATRAAAAPPSPVADDDPALRVARLERARALFARGLDSPGSSIEATWGYVIATLSLQRLEPDLLDRAIQAYASAPGNPDLAVAVALVHEAEGRADEAQRFWAAAARNLRPGPERDRIIGRMGRTNPGLPARQATESTP